MSIWERITTILIPATFIIWGVYDVITIWRGGTGTSISRKIAKWKSQYFQFWFAFFYILGHLFWPQPELDSRTITLEDKIVSLKEELRVLNIECKSD